MIRAAVCGLGIGMAHCAGYLEAANVELVAVADRIPERLDHVGGTFDAGSMVTLRGLFEPGQLSKSWGSLGVETFRSLDELLELGEFDLLSLCTPDYLHFEQACRILEQRKHLLLEKPVALTLRDARALLRRIAAAEAEGIRVGIGYEFRENPAVLRVKGLIDQGRIGEVEAISIHHFRTPFRRDKWERWIQDQRKSGGLIVEETSHWFDLLRFLTKGEIEELHCVTTDRIHPDFDYEDVAYIQGRLEGGVAFQIEHSLAGFDFSFTISVYGTKGSIRCGLKEELVSNLDAGQTDYVGIVSFGQPNRPEAGVETELFGAEVREPETIRANVIRFAAAIESGAPLRCPAQDGVRALEAALLANRSASLNRVCSPKELETNE